jgi:N6-adenosine-specific RNA methylase IME4
MGTALTNGSVLAGTRDAIALIDTARRALAEAKSIPEVKDVLDKAKAVEKYLRQRDLGTEASQDAAELTLRAERRLGELLSELPREQGKRTDRTSLPNGTKLQATGIKPVQAHGFQRVAAIPEALFEEHVRGVRSRGQWPTTAGTVRLATELRRQRHRDQNRELVNATAPVEIAVAATVPTVVLDPPWDYADEGNADPFGRGLPTYATMTMDQIADLPVAHLAQPNAHLYLWVTNRSLPKGLALLERWGFRYVTCLTWHKSRFGMGTYFRGQSEHVLFGVRGSMPLLRKDAGTVFSGERPGRHSAKPDEFYRLVETCSPGPWLEMFARKLRQGWVSWGAEVTEAALGA